MDDSILQLYWCGPEKVQNLKEYIHEVLKLEALKREVQTLAEEAKDLEKELKLLRSEKNIKTSTNEEIKSDTKFYTDITNDNNMKGARLVRCLNCIVMNQKYPELFRMDQETSGSTYTCICKIKPVTKGKEYLYKDIFIPKNCICKNAGISIIRYSIGFIV